MTSIESSKSPKTPLAPSSCRPFPYQAIAQKGPAGDSPSVLQPAISIKVRHPTKDQIYPVSALLDSGADRTTFPSEWAAVFGIDLDECKAIRVRTAMGLTFLPVSETELEIAAAGRVIAVQPCFAPVSVAILGRRDFFSQFRVEFDERERVTRLTPYDEP